MSFWSSQRLEQNLANILGTPNPSMVDCNAITLSVGSEIYITPDHTSPNTHTKQTLATNQAFSIPPGQFAFLVTEEIVSIPPDTMGFISIKATYKLRGLVNVSGFHVDPGWKGSLIFSVFNAGPAPVHLQRGLPLFLLWIADLDAVSDKRKTQPGQNGIPTSMINNITGIVGSIDELDKRMREELKKLVEKDEVLSNRVHDVEKSQTRVLVWAAVLGGILLAATGGAVKSAVASFFEKPAAISVQPAASEVQPAASAVAGANLEIKSGEQPKRRQ